MNKFEVVIDSRLEVRFGEEIYKTRVQDRNNKNLLISVPVAEGGYLTLKTGDEIDLVYYDNRANIFNFNCRIINKITENGTLFYSTTLPYNVVKIQRRNYVRVDTVQVIKEIRKYDEKTKTVEGNQIFNALLLDLSGGGMRVKLKEHFEEGDIIIAKIGNGDGELPIKGRVVRIDVSEDKKYIYGISFLELDSRTREQIIGTVFRIMRRQRELQ